MGRVELLDEPISASTFQAAATQLEYLIDVAPDCAGTDHENGDLADMLEQDF